MQKIENNIVCFDGTRINPRNKTRRKLSLFIYNSFCSIWISTGITSNQAKEELRINFEVVDNVISDKHGKGSIDSEYKPEKGQFHLTNMIVYDLENFNIDRAVPYANCIYRPTKIAGNFK